MKKILYILPVLIILAACGQAPLSDGVAVIEAQSEVWDEALNAGDIDTLVGLYTSDARILQPDGETMSGEDGVRAAFGGMIDAGIKGETAIVEVSAAGDIGYKVGTYKMLIDGEVIATGKFIETWRRGEDGQWRISNDIWNGDAAASAAGGDMAHLMIMHEVADGDHWLAAWSGENSRHDLFEANGAAHVHTFRSADNPNLTGLVVSVSDMEALNAMLASDEGKAAAAEDGVDLDNMTVLMETD